MAAREDVTQLTSSHFGANRVNLDQVRRVVLHVADPAALYQRVQPRITQRRPLLLHPQVRDEPAFLVALDQRLKVVRHVDITRPLLRKESIDVRRQLAP